MPLRSTGSFNRLLTWDYYEFHVTDSVSKDLMEMNLDSVIIPGGCSKYIQASDVCWKKSLKAWITELYYQWLNEGVHQLPEGGNMKPLPGKQ